MEQIKGQRPSGLGELLAMGRGNPSALFNQLMRTNPSFVQFCNENKGKTPEQAFRDYGLDFEQVKGMLR